MTLISCPECKREVSDKALSCPGCGYPLHNPLQQRQSSAEVPATGTASTTSGHPAQQPTDVLITGPSGYPLRQEAVGAFCPFLEWLLGVNDRDYTREWMVKEWSRDELSSHIGIVTSMAVLADFTDAHEQTREYWRDVFLYRLPPHMANISELIHEVCKRASITVREEKLPLTREVCYAHLKHMCFKASVLSGVDIEATWLSKNYKNHYWEAVKNLPDAGAGAYVVSYLSNAYFHSVWALWSDADKIFLKKQWSEETEYDPWLQALLRFAQEQIERRDSLASLSRTAHEKLQKQQEMTEFLKMKAWERENQDGHVVPELQAKQQEHNFVSDVLRWNHDLAMTTLHTWKKC